MQLIQLSYKRISRHSGIREIFACEIQNPGIWNPEFSRGICNTAIEWNLESKFHYNTRNPESIACDPDSTVWNSELETVLNYLTRGDTVVFYILSTLNLTNFLTDTSEIRTPRVGPYLSLHRTRSLSINDDDGYENVS